MWNQLLHLNALRWLKISLLSKYIYPKHNDKYYAVELGSPHLFLKTAVPEVSLMNAVTVLMFDHQIILLFLTDNLDAYF